MGRRLKQLQRTVIPNHFIMRLLRAGQRIARPLNCGVMRSCVRLEVSC